MHRGACERFGEDSHHTECTSYAVHAESARSSTEKDEWNTVGSAPLLPLPSCAQADSQVDVFGEGRGGLDVLQELVGKVQEQVRGEAFHS